MKLYQIVQRNKSLILLIVYIILSAVLAYIYLAKSNYTDNDPIFKSVLFYIVMATTLCFIVLLHICITNRSYLILALGTIFLFLFLSEISYFIYYGQIISEGILDSIIETNSYEVFAMAKQVFIVTGPALIVTFIILFILRKVVYVKFKLIVPLAYYIIGLFLTIYTMIHSPLRNDIKQGHYKSSISLVRSLFPAVLGNLSYLYIGWVSKDIYSDTNEIQQFNEAILLPPEQSTNDLVVLIMGESSLVTRYSVYGYNKQTTPFMADIFSQKGGCIVHNSHSAASLTRDSLPMSLSFNVPESDDNLFNNKSIIEMAKFNNYKTYWLASAAQGIRGTFDTKFGFIARKSDIVSFSNDSDDVNLSKLLEENLKKDSTQKKFIFIHLRGSHKPYTGYDQLDKEALPDAEEYDLTIHHTDRAIKSLYDIINKYSNNYTLIYTSDHGEIVNVGHGMVGGVDQFLIPFMFVSTNDQYNCQFIESFRAPTGYLSALMNKYILSNLLGYKIDQIILDNEKNNDRIFMADGNVMPFLSLFNNN